MKLHLGCYNKKIYGFTNVDIRPEVNPDIVDDIFTLDKFTDNSAELIYACHVLEHLDRVESKTALKNWYRVLKPNGIVRISVPDIDKVIRHYIYYQDITYLYSFLWGSQRHPYDYHKHGWNFQSLKQDLEKTGFKQVKLYDWHNTEHYYIDDYSQAYCPHLDKQNGQLMSLNIEATK